MPMCLPGVCCCPYRFLKIHHLIRYNPVLSTKFHSVGGSSLAFAGVLCLLVGVMASRWFCRWAFCLVLEDCSV